MNNKEFFLKYGKKTISFEIPEELLLYDIKGRNHPPYEDLAEAYLSALDQPIDSPPLKNLLKRTDRIAIIVSDITRSWQRNAETLPVLLDYLNREGVADEQVTIIIGVGGHRKNTEEEFIELCSADVCHRVRVVNHDAWDSENMVHVGKTSRGTEVRVNRIVTEADKVILTGGVIYHYMAGFGGGRKSILPGVASIETIQQNHLLGLKEKIGGGSSPLSASAITEGNPLHEDMMEIAALVDPDFLVNVVPNLDGEIAGIFTGNWITAWHKACQLVVNIFGVEIEHQADIVIASAGGYPKDINLYQSQKTIDNASYAMKPGGVSIIVAECPLIEDPPEFFDWFKHKDIVSLEKAARKNFLISGWLAIKQLEYEQLGTILLLTEEKNVELASKAHVEPVTSMEEALRIALQRCGKQKPRITIMSQGANTFPILKS